MKKVVPIAFAFDENLVMPACVCITSLLMNASDDTFYDIFILYQQSAKFDIDEIDQLQNEFENCRITYREVDGSFNNAYEIRGITTAAYYRLLIPMLIPEYDKILYSDVDVIFRGDLSVFYDVDITDYYFAGVDVGIKYRDDIRKYVHDVLKLDPYKGYFYSGNLVINSKKILQDGLVDIFRMHSNRNYRFQDMDIINIVCNGRIKALSPEFCLTNYLYFLLMSRNDGEIGYTNNELDLILKKGIIHYNGAKPWKSTCLNQDVWWYYYRKSCVFNESFCKQYYENVFTEMDRWSFIKRLRHLLRYFTNK
jgi:lipopolysaccharide biosynthesis glycosyltransferase